MFREDECSADIANLAGNIRIIKMLDEFSIIERKLELEIKNTGEKDDQIQEESNLNVEKTVSQPEESHQDQLESLVNSMRRDIMNSLDEIKAEIRELKDIINSQKDVKNQVEPHNSLYQNSNGKDSLEDFYGGTVKHLFYPVVVDHITSRINAFKKRIPQNILDQYPELPAALITTAGPISTLFETYNFLRDIPTVNPEQTANSQILKILKGFRQVAETLDHQELKMYTPEKSAESSCLVNSFAFSGVKSGNYPECQIMSGKRQRDV